ncbi:O-antigen export system permease [Enterovibrio norvegicus FF-33]|uniref:ABC transporter permease n=1 Tax=Enterovibrio norvegicus TaxID=188144 RepID=UPI0002DA5254|nr:ABC transporter permease [Enterovibrio norvegicus]OEE68107.1 O-antigen export system permease [Enterovibrio norvegicus FF-33]
MNVLKNRDLIQQISKRNIHVRYKGSMLGICWSLLNPLFLLTVYTFVFGFIFKAKWGDGSLASYPVILFSGLIFHFFFIEVLSTSSQLITSNGNYVKKVVFPLEVLVISNFISHIFNLLIGFSLLIAAIIVTGGDAINAFFGMLIIAPPFLILTLGLSYIFSSFGVYIKDIVHVVGLASTLFLFASPILFPIDTLPEVVQSVVYINPISFVVDGFRSMAFATTEFSLYGYAIYSVLSVIFYCLGKIAFRRLSRGFSDVV